MAWLARDVAYGIPHREGGSLADLSVQGRKRMSRIGKLALFTAFALTLAVPTQVSGGSFSSLVFTQTDPEAIVMAEELRGYNAGQMRFERLDPETLKLGGGSFLLVKDPMLGRMKTKYAELHDFDMPSFFSSYSRFSATRKPAGVYAFTEHLMTTGPYSGSQCLKVAIPVFRFKPGVANLVPNAVFPTGGYSDFHEYQGLIFRQKVPENLHAAGTPDPLVDAQRVLDERPGIKARVEYAEFLGYVAWQNDKGEISGCYRSKKLIWVTEEMLRTAKVRDYGERRPG